MKAFLLLSLFLSSLSAKEVTVGSKSFTESILISEMISILLEEKYQEKVNRKFSLGGTKVVFDALRTKQIDIYSDYTGTGYISILKQSRKLSAKETFQLVQEEFEQRYNILWSRPLGVNNTYALAVKKDSALFDGITSISELQSIQKRVRYAAPYEFMERKDGHQNLLKEYQLQFAKDKVISMQAGLMYSAISNEKVDLIVVYSTDARIKTHHLKILKDDKSFFPAYELSLLAHKSSLDSYPNIKKVFNSLEGNISDEEIIELNKQVDHDKLSPYQVARNFLIKKSLLDGSQKTLIRESSFIQFAINKKDYLLKLIFEHLLLTFTAVILAIIFSIPLGIFLVRNENWAKLVFPLVNITQTIPSLALLGFLVPIVGIGFLPAVIALFLYSLLPIIRNTYSAIMNIEREYIEAAMGMGLTKKQILFKVELPLALPMILTAIKTSAVIAVGTATIAAFVGSGGLGDPIFRGISTVNTNLILLGSIPSAFLALFIDKLLSILERKLVSKGIYLQQNK